MTADDIDILAATDRQRVVAKVLREEFATDYSARTCVNVAQAVLLALDEDDNERKITGQLHEAEYLNYDEVIVTVEIELRRRRPGGPGESTIYRRGTVNPLSLTGRAGQAAHIRGIVAREVEEFLDNGIPETAGLAGRATTPEVARPRSCPNCHSPGQVILGPFDDQTCTDRWHEREAS